MFFIFSQYTIIWEFLQIFNGALQDLQAWKLHKFEEESFRTKILDFYALNSQNSSRTINVDFLKRIKGFPMDNKSGILSIFNEILQGHQAGNLHKFEMKSLRTKNMVCQENVSLTKNVNFFIDFWEDYSRTVNVFFYEIQDEFVRSHQGLKALIFDFFKRIPQGLQMWDF